MIAMLSACRSVLAARTLEATSLISMSLDSSLVLVSAPSILAGPLRPASRLRRRVLPRTLKTGGSPLRLVGVLPYIIALVLIMYFL
jgi:hypothetical protein